MTVFWVCVLGFKMSVFGVFNNLGFKMSAYVRFWVCAGLSVCGNGVFVDVV